MTEGQVGGLMFGRDQGQLLGFRFLQPSSGFYFVRLRHGFSV